MSAGASMGICRGVPHILEDLKLVEPTLLYSVPALYKKVHDGVLNGMQDASPVKRTLMRSALRLGRSDAAYRNGVVRDDGSTHPPLGYIDRIKHWVLDSIVLSRIRSLFGGRLRAGFVAGAACHMGLNSPEILGTCVLKSPPKTSCRHGVETQIAFKHSFSACKISPIGPFKATSPESGRCACTRTI